MGGEIHKQDIAMQYYKYYNVGKNSVTGEDMRHLTQACCWGLWVKFDCPELKRQNQTNL